MKLPKVAALLIIVLTIFTTGCDTSTESPENLLNENIVYDESKQELYNFVNKSLDGKTLLLPKNSSEVGQINNVDSNIIAFQQKEDVNSNSYKVGFVLISKDQEVYEVRDSILEDGSNIEYANFYDLNNDGSKEIILIINHNSSITMNVYSIENNKIKQISEIEPTWLQNYKKFTTMKIKVGNLNNDSQLDIIMLNGDNSSGDMYATILNYDKKNQMKISNSVKISNVKNLQDTYLTIGKVSNNKTGVVLSMPTLKENSYATQILCINNNKLEKVFNDDNIILNSYYVPIKDVNNDKVLEIPVLNNKMIDTYTTSSKQSSLVNWRKWNNEIGKKADTIFVSQVYYNYKHNFKFLVPDNLANKLYIKRGVYGDTPYYNFYYFDNENNTKNIELFQINISPKGLTEEAKASAGMEGIIDESENNYYQLYVKDKKSFEKYNLTLDTIKDYFSVIYE